jgi:hypothetical protein
VVYVDNDPMVVAHSRALKTGGRATVVEADLREPEAILDRARELLNLTQPVAILLVAVLHFVGEDDKPGSLVSTLLDAVPAGSWLALSHVTGDFSVDRAARSATEYRQVSPGATVRSRDQILAFFDGLELAAPGLVQVPQWRPEEPVSGGLADMWFLGGAGRKR